MADIIIEDVVVYDKGNLLEILAAKRCIKSSVIGKLTKRFADVKSEPNNHDIQYEIHGYDGFFFANDPGGTNIMTETTCELKEALVLQIDDQAYRRNLSG
ncbi:hypothetical protein PR003_g1536 [Phytophthora rubi]|uniref:Uncharacterized protein n=1 Tax=Phytophthora rubi TaxID=129364 RepID=A0A6A3LB45_9STRA|nr:hypothetical protein PR002_g13700 [Phytophthora rubi]KAE9051592.1 hypothetical protein PR001_g1303 [Phytophthora rubi]KAE9357953.1 hypothetical protein PR003_g1536 [Phytophthora rubi]